MFTTERLEVRQLKMGDLDALCSVYGDREAMRYVGDAEPLSRDRCIEWVGVTENNYRARGYGMSAIALIESDEVIGFCGLVHPDGQPEPEIKYALEREHWGCGYATEAVLGMLAYGLKRFGLARIIATVDPCNAASLHVLDKVGMSALEMRRDDDGSETAVLVWRG